MIKILKRWISATIITFTLASAVLTIGCSILAPTFLSKCKLVKGPIYMEGITKNASGLTYDKITDSLYVVINKPAQIVQLSTDGKFIRKIQLLGFSDLEGIALISQNKFAVVEEANAVLHYIDINRDTATVSINDVSKSVKIDNPQIMVLKKKNKNKLQTNGIEALGYNPETRTMLTAKEKKPQKLYTVSLDTINQPFPANEAWPVKHLGLGDISGVSILPKLKHILLLSDKSSKIVETSLNGKILDTLELRYNESLIQDAEGITVDSKGNIYVCAEPNSLYVFRKVE